MSTPTLLHLSPVRAKVCDALQIYTVGLTCEELEEETNLLHQTVSSALVHLKNAGVVVHKLEYHCLPRYRKTKQGRDAAVYTLAEEYRNAELPPIRV